MVKRKETKLGGNYHRSSGKFYSTKMVSQKEDTNVIFITECRFQNR